ncbi:hypothetical protein [Aureibacter tunicatorum]|uniref:Mannose-6-phosphate isomerase n=1 Tax=Aureibacter tunicatorum TaxID=866807 RepID=A0AAE3XPQ8_9BACT|nr:hypothetical protein [Aureibacter tunicatorum]MDR6239686.1 hypothetical protein [Aureibacter tunicatorum]BDD04162.1 hypothetical protein AUTU_16450 [Aureibacter tunicatorum]
MNTNNTINSPLLVKDSPAKGLILDLDSNELKKWITEKENPFSEHLEEMHEDVFPYRTAIRTFDEENFYCYSDKRTEDEFSDEFTHQLLYVLDCSDDSILIQYASEIKNMKLSKGSFIFIPSGAIWQIKGSATFFSMEFNPSMNQEILNEQSLNTIQKTIGYRSDVNVQIVNFEKNINETSSVLSSPYFHCNLLEFNEPILFDNAEIKSFIMYYVVSGDVEIIEHQSQTKVYASQGQTVLLPATSTEAEIYNLTPEGFEIIEMYVI